VTKGLHEFKFKEACAMTGVLVNNARIFFCTLYNNRFSCSKIRLVRATVDVHISSVKPKMMFAVSKL